MSITPTAPGSLAPFWSATGDFTSLGKGYLLIEQTHFGGGYRIWQAASPAGPWTQVASGSSMPYCPTGTNAGCYGIIPHVEMSTTDNLEVTVHTNQDGFIHPESLGTIPDLP